jgi:molecular chaperone GrpE
MEAAYRAAHPDAGPLLTPAQLADCFVRLKAAIGGGFHVVEVGEDAVVLANTRCPFGDAVRRAPALCRMTSSVFGGIAARNHPGGASVVLEERIAVGDPGCRVVVRLGRRRRRGCRNRRRGQVMADPTTGEEGAGRGPVIRDRRRIDPETGRVREAYTTQAGVASGAATGTTAATGAETDAASSASASASVGPAGEAASVNGRSTPAGWSGGGADPDRGADGGSAVGAAQVRDTEVENALADQMTADLATARSAAEERLADLQRLQAEYVNYRRRVDRDRDVAPDLAVAGVLEALLPVLDDVHLARQHGDLEAGPFAAIAEKLEATLGRLGLTRYGEPGEVFDPTVHEALMHTQAELAEGTTDPTVVQVLQPGYRVGERVLRAARVAVADPQ